MVIPLVKYRNIVWFFRYIRYLGNTIGKVAFIIYLFVD